MHPPGSYLGAGPGYYDRAARGCDVGGACSGGAASACSGRAANARSKSGKGRAKSKTTITTTVTRITTSTSYRYNPMAKVTLSDEVHLLGFDLWYAITFGK